MSPQNLYTTVHTNSIHDIQNVQTTERPLADEWIRVHTAGHYLAIKKEPSPERCSRQTLKLLC